MLSIFLGNLAEMAWCAAGFLTTRPLSPSMPLYLMGSSTDHSPTYAHSSSASSVDSFLALDDFHRWSQSSVNCSRKSPLRVVGYRATKVVSIYQLSREGGVRIVRRHRHCSSAHQIGGGRHMGAMAGAGEIWNCTHSELRKLGGDRRALCSVVGAHHAREHGSGNRGGGSVELHDCLMLCLTSGIRLYCSASWAGKNKKARTKRKKVANWLVSKAQ